MQFQKKRCLVVEDEQDIAQVLSEYMAHNGYDVDMVYDGQDALDKIAVERYDIVLLDQMLPTVDGTVVLKNLQKFRSSTGIIMITARVEEIDRLLALELGADDYICKPFSLREVLARVKAVMRRIHPDPALPVTTRHWALDANRHRLQIRGADVDLTVKEFDLFKILSSNPGRVYSRQQLLDLAYPAELDASERAIDSHVKNLRRKLAAVDPSRLWIRSVYGVGFAFEDEA
ncbi:response regulator [Curvibacter sp. CHRR-16]|uniref:response regulator n=1 Tax=Curvibacter sp. CHRR-16 TaxID=2835872 RepID=UPI001BD9792D|nr:response regulator [Curvibacter sp. CHRR-16]MBT0571736.1 response regulator [Curvibacter sp. CHRR-16]